MALPWTHYLEMNPPALGWNSLTTVDNMIKGKYEAEAGFDARSSGGFTMPKIKGRYRLVLDDDFRVVVWPVGDVWKDANKTAALLEHEDMHYRFGHILARALINDLSTFSAQKTAQFQNIIGTKTTLHMRTRARALNAKYDKDTDHGTHTVKQQRWVRAMALCVNDDTATSLMGLPL